MDITLQQEKLSCWSPVYTACLSQESTAESVVPDRMPDVYRLLDTEAAVYLRRKSVGQGQISLEGEIHAAVLFRGEEDQEIWKLDFELPCSYTVAVEGAGENDRLRARLIIHRADARIVNPRKLGIAVETRAVVELYRSTEAAITTGADSDALETLCREETVIYAAEVGEKSFAVMEECAIPSGRPAIREILHARAEAAISDQKTVGGKSILQGSARWELQYLDSEGNPARERFDVPFSQLIDIPEDIEAMADVILTAESAYAELLPSMGGADSVSLEVHLTAQTVCWARRKMTVLADVYSVRRPCRAQTSQLALTSPGERLTLRGTADGSLELGAEVTELLYAHVEAGIPEVTEGTVRLPIRLHALCRTEDGELRSVSRSAAVSFPETAESETLQFGEAMCAEPYITPAGERLDFRVNVELPAMRMEETVCTCVSAAEWLEETEPEEAVPSLIVMRYGGESLWELAKRCHSTVGMIESANPEPGTELLLIPRAR